MADEDSAQLKSLTNALLADEDFIKLLATEIQGRRPRRRLFFGVALRWWSSAALAAVVVEGKVDPAYYGGVGIILGAALIFQKRTRDFLNLGGSWRIETRSKLLVIATSVGMPGFGIGALEAVHHHHGNLGVILGGCLLLTATAGVPYAASRDYAHGEFDNLMARV